MEELATKWSLTYIINKIISQVLETKWSVTKQVRSHLLFTMIHKGCYGSGQPRPNRPNPLWALGFNTQAGPNLKF